VFDSMDVLGWIVGGLWMSYRWIVDGLWMDCGWIEDGLWMDCRWIVDGLWMDCGWIVDGLWMDCGWIVDGLWMDCGWKRPTTRPAFRIQRCGGGGVSHRSWRPHSTKRMAFGEKE